MFDEDKSATISFDEFKQLWRFVTEWEKVFRNFDHDQSGSINKAEFQQALTAFGKKRRNEPQ